MPCPHCGSDNTRRDKYSRKAFGWALFLFGVPLAIRSDTWMCFGCHRSFRMVLPEDAIRSKRRARLLTLVLLAAIVITLVLVACVDRD